MTIEEYNNLCWLEDNNKLPCPKNMIVNIPEMAEIDITPEWAWKMAEAKNELKKVNDLQSLITFLFVDDIKKLKKAAKISDQIDFDEETAKAVCGKPIEEKPIIIAKLAIKSSSIVESFEGEGTYPKPYKIKTKYGKGCFFDEKELFNGEWPKFLKPNECYYTSRILAREIEFGGIETEQLTGIAYFDGPFLHSVVVMHTPAQDWVIDSNYHLVMSYDLYVKLFSFETLSTISGKQILESKPILDDFKKLLKKRKQTLNYGTIAFAYDDIVNIVTNNNVTGV